MCRHRTVCRHRAAAVWSTCVTLHRVENTRRDLVCALVTGLAFAGCAERAESTRAPDQAEEIAAPVGERETEIEPPAEPPAPMPEAPEVVPPPPASPVDALVGRHRFSGGEAQKAAIARAVEDVVDRMGLLSRGIARKRLLAANAIPRAIEIARDGDLVTVVIDDRRYVARIGGKPVKVRGSDGKPSRMRYRMRNGSLVQVFDAAEGDRINVFTPREGGGIALHVTITSPKLPADVKYRLSYREAAAEPAV
jgi:hypothetical protein